MTLRELPDPGAKAATAQRGLAVVLSLIVVATPSVSAAAPEPLDLSTAAGILREWGAQQLGLNAEDVVVFGPDRIALPDDSGNYAVANVSAPDARSSVSGYLDLDTGALLSEPEFEELAAEVAASMEPYTAELRAQLERADEDDPITVGVAVFGGSGAAVVDPVRESFAAISFAADEPVTEDDALKETIQDAIIEAWSASALATTAPVIRATEALGMKIEHVGQLAPMFWATGTRAEISELATIPEIITIYPSAATTLTMSSARPTDQADYGISQGWDGSGVRVAVVEYHNVNWANSAFNGANCKSSFSTGAIALDPAPDHPSWVMGAIGSQSATHKGIAPEACLISVGTGGYTPNSVTQDYEILEAVDIAVDPAQGDADVVNLSIVQDTTAGRAALRDYIDHVVRMGIAVSASGGNQPNCPDDKVLSPGTAWNVVTVGTISDQNDSSWGNDIVGDHCWIDPVGGNFKPEISAPGKDVISAGQDFLPVPYYTSIAVPQVAGTFAQVIEINPAELRGSPVRVKAIVLAASHVHMVDAGTQPERLDAQEGMGSLTTKWADVIASRQTSGGIFKGNYGKKTFSGTFDPVSGCMETSGVHQSQTFALEPGKFTRVAVTWFSNGFYEEGSGFGTNDISADALEVDFDIRVYTAGGVLKAFRSHELHNVEFVQFTAAAGESPYRLEIDPVEWGCGVASQAAGWAYVSWNQP